jgi:hypothetical protein
VGDSDAPDKAVVESDEQSAPEEAVTTGIEWLARLGYITKGIIYIAIGLLILEVLVGLPRLELELMEEEDIFEVSIEAPDTNDVFWEVIARPYGPYLLGALALGLGGYVLWRVVQAVRDTEDKGSSPKGIAQRVGYILMGVAYAGLLFTALQVLLGLAANNAEGGALDDWTARALGWPGGPWLVGLFGLAVIAVAVEELYRAHRTDLCENMRLDQMHRFIVTCATLAGKFGVTARGIIYGIIGVFLVQAAVEYEPEEVEGLGGALEWLAQQTFGIWLLAAAAAGLMAYGLYAILEARYRRFEVD